MGIGRLIGTRFKSKMVTNKLVSKIHSCFKTNQNKANIKYFIISSSIICKWEHKFNSILSV